MAISMQQVEFEKLREHLSHHELDRFQAMSDAILSCASVAHDMRGLLITMREMNSISPREIEALRYMAGVINGKVQECTGLPLVESE